MAQTSTAKVKETSKLSSSVFEDDDDEIIHYQ